MQPATLNELIDHVNSTYMTFTFRFRDTRTGLDYLTCQFATWKWNRHGNTDNIKALLLDGGMCGYYPFTTKTPEFALLSTAEEIRRLGLIGESESIKLLKTSYETARRDGCF